MRPSVRCRSTVVVAMSCSLALLMVGCGGDQTSTSSSDSGARTESGATVELTIATFNEFGYADLYREYEAANPNVKITERKAATVDEHI